MKVARRAPWAGVRKPPKEETAEDKAGWCVRRYGDLDAAGLLPRWVGSFFGRRSRVRRSGAGGCAAEMERHGDYREPRDGEHGHCRPIAGAAEVQHWDVASNLI